MLAYFWQFARSVTLVANDVPLSKSVRLKVNTASGNPHFESSGFIFSNKSYRSIEVTPFSQSYASCRSIAPVAAIETHIPMDAQMGALSPKFGIDTDESHAHLAIESWLDVADFVTAIG